jgi:hypothetical protein
MVMRKEISINFTYIEEVFDSKEEFRHFILLMYAEFQEAVDVIVSAILKQDVYAFRKILHNVGTHLEMLRAEELKSMLELYKQQITDKDITEEEKKMMIANVRSDFAALLDLLSYKNKEISLIS